MKYEEKIISKLKELGLTITTVESLTGGLLAGTLVNVSGASEVYSEGYITYSDEAKHRLVGVKEETLKMYTAVSAQTAEEMARGAAKVAGTDIALSTTGYAGPEGDPVGRVYVGCYFKGDIYVKEFNFTGNREENRKSALESALILLDDILSKC